MYYTYFPISLFSHSTAPCSAMCPVELVLRRALIHPFWPLCLYVREALGAPARLQLVYGNHIVDGHSLQPIISLV